MSRKHIIPPLLSFALVLLTTCVTKDPVTPENERHHDPSGSSGLYMAPIEGVTTVWHPTPVEFSVPKGTRVMLRCYAGRDDVVRWSGAEEVARDEDGSLAATFLERGTHVVEARIERATTDDPGTKERQPGEMSPASDVVYTCEITGVDARFEEMVVEKAEITRQRELPDEMHLTNWQGVREIKHGSVANVVMTSAERCVTSIGTAVQLVSMVQPSSLGALVEWRVDGRAVLLGASGSYTCDNTPGEHAIEAGPVGRSRTVYLDTYAVTIESNAGLSQVQDGTFVTFRAITEPPGYESQVTWLASTLYGLVSQVTGTGEMFTARFDGSITNGDPPRWIGVRADNALLFTDCCVPPGNCVCNSIAWSLPLNVMPSCPPFGFGNNQYAVVQVTNTGPPETLTYKVFDYDLETPNDLLYEATKLCPTGTSTLNLEAFLFSDANCNVTGYGGSSGGFPEAEGRTAEVFYVLYAPGGGALCITSIQDVTCPP